MTNSGTSVARGPGIADAVGALHGKFVFSRRVRTLANYLAALIPSGARVLDVGCGDGTVARLIAEKLPAISIEGIDVLVRPNTCIPVRPFDGVTIPFPGDSFDVAMLVDVLHHTGDPLVLLREAARVAKTVLIKDHFRQGFLAGPTLRLMDWVGNASHGVALPYNYWTKAQWNVALDEAGLRAARMELKLGLYPPPASWLFDRGLHFIAKGERSD